MAMHWTHSIDSIDWNELSELYRIAPLGNKSADWLKTAYSNSIFKCIAHDGERIVAAGRAVADSVDYEKFGFRRMNTAMAIFSDPGKAKADGYVR